MAKKINTILDVFKLFGSNVQLAKILGVSPSGVSEMKRRWSIPVEYWQPLLKAAQKADGKEVDPKDLTLEKLVVVSANAPRDKAKAKAKEVAA
jgi:hypothetical protein